MIAGFVDETSTVAGIEAVAPTATGGAGGAGGTGGAEGEALIVDIMAVDSSVCVRKS